MKTKEVVFIPTLSRSRKWKIIVIFWPQEVPHISLSNKILVLDFMMTEYCQRWVVGALNSMVGTKIWPWGQTGKILSALESTYLAGPSFLYSKIWCKKYHGEGFTLQAAKYHSLLFPTKPLVHWFTFITPNASHPGPSAQVWAATSAWEPGTVGGLCTLWDAYQKPGVPRYPGYKVSGVKWVLEYTRVMISRTLARLMVKSTDLGDRLFWVWISAGWFISSCAQKLPCLAPLHTVLHIRNEGNRLSLTNLLWTLHMTLYIKAQY